MKKLIGYTAPIWMPFALLAVAFGLHYVAGVDMDDAERSFAAMMSLFIGVLIGALVALWVACED